MVNSIICSSASDANFQLKLSAIEYENGFTICNETHKHLKAFQAFVWTAEQQPFGLI